MQEVRDLLYCLYDHGYFETSVENDETLTQSMVFNEEEIVEIQKQDEILRVKREKEAEEKLHKMEERLKL